MAQFLSPDPFIQAPGNWYNYNRYGYCLNNPLMYNDPSGYFIKWLGRKLNKFGRWVEKSFDNLGDYLTKHNVSIGVGVNMTPGGGPTTYNASINGRQVFNSANGNQFNPAVNVERGLNQMRMGESITSGNLAYQNAMVSEGISSSSIGQLSFGISTGIGNGIMTELEKEIIRQHVFNSINAHPNFRNPEPEYVSFRAPKWLRVIGKYGGYGFSAWGAIDIYNQHEIGKISESKMWTEQGSNIIGALPIVGTAWTFGWETGRVICNTTCYQKFKYNLWKNYYEWRMGGSIESDPVLWNHFHRHYKP